MAPTDERLPPKVNVNDLTFAFPDGSTGLEKIGLELPANSRTLLIGGMLMPIP
jgi:CCR4-NOT complex subunit CAF16